MFTSADRADLAAAGSTLLYQHGVGLAFLATVRSDGGTRVPAPKNEDAFCISGAAQLIEDAESRSVLASPFVDERSQFSVPPPSDDDALFAFRLETCLLTRTVGQEEPVARHLGGAAIAVIGSRRDRTRSSDGRRRPTRGHSGRATTPILVGNRSSSAPLQRWDSHGSKRVSDL